MTTKTIAVYEALLENDLKDRLTRNASGQNPIIQNLPISQSEISQSTSILKLMNEKK